MHECVHGLEAPASYRYTTETKVTDILNRINKLIAERQELFRRGADGFLPPDERARMKELTAELAQLWDAHRRIGHPPAEPPVPDDWERPRRGRKPKQPVFEVDRAA